MDLFSRKVIFKAMVGSHNYNLANKESDVDYKVFVAPTFEDLYKNKEYHKSIISHSDGNDYDAHDIRKLTNLFYKANINFLEVLASKDIQLETDAEEILKIMSMKNEIFKMNLPYLYNACFGMHLTKFKQLEKGTEGTQHLVDKYGYDTKQATHAFRVLKFLKDFHDGSYNNFEEAIWYDGEDLELMLKIRHGGFTLEEYKEFVLDYKDNVVNPLKDEYYSQKPNDELKEEIDTLLMKYIKKEITNND